MHGFIQKTSKIKRPKIKENHPVLYTTAPVSKKIIKKLLKILYSCMPNMNSQITSRNLTMLEDKTEK